MAEIFEGMTEETTGVLPESLFDEENDAADGETEDTHEGEEKPANPESEPESGTESGTEPEKAEDGKELTTIKVLGQERKVTKEELIALAQKGADYDRVRARRDESDGVLLQLAKAAGMSREDYIKNVSQAILQGKIEKRKAELVAQGRDLDSAGQIARLEAEKEELRQKEEQENAAKMQRKMRDDAVRDDIRSLLKLYPDLKEFPPEVIRMCEGGLMPSAAYQKYLLDQKEIEVKQLRQDRKNREVSPGAVSNEGRGQTDPFLAGFMGE